MKGFQQQTRRKERFHFTTFGFNYCFKSSILLFSIKRRNAHSHSHAISKIQTSLRFEIHFGSLQQSCKCIRAKHLLMQAVIICATGNSYQLYLFSVSISQISSQNGALMKQQYYDKNKELCLSCLSCKRDAQNHTDTLLPIIWIQMNLNLCTIEINEVPQNNQTVLLGVMDQG